MGRFECEFEADVLSAALQSRWPERVDARLRDHAASCPVCSEVAAVATAIDRDNEGLRAAVVVPDWSSVWWRAQLRARREAAQTAGRPITAIQIVAFGATVAVLGACFGATSAWFQSVLGRVTATVSAVPFSALVVDHGALILSMAAIVILIPALCLVLLRD